MHSQREIIGCKVPKCGVVEFVKRDKFGRASPFLFFKGASILCASHLMAWGTSCMEGQTKQECHFILGQQNRIRKIDRREKLTPSEKRMRGRDPTEKYRVRWTFALGFETLVSKKTKCLLSPKHRQILVQHGGRYWRSQCLRILCLEDRRQGSCLRRGTDSTRVSSSRKWGELNQSERMRIKMYAWKQFELRYNVPFANTWPREANETSWLYITSSCMSQLQLVNSKGEKKRSQVADREEVEFISHQLKSWYRNTFDFTTCSLIIEKRGMDQTKASSIFPLPVFLFMKINSPRRWLSAGNDSVCYNLV